MKRKHWGTGSDKRIMSVVTNVVEKMKVPVTVINITQISEYRIDAHASIYTETGGRLLTDEEKADPLHHADCIHWCLPGVPDTWNQIFLAHLQENQKIYTDTPCVFVTTRCRLYIAFDFFFPNPLICSRKQKFWPNCNSKCNSFDLIRPLIFYIFQNATLIFSWFQNIQILYISYHNTAEEDMNMDLSYHDKPRLSFKEYLLQIEYKEKRNNFCTILDMIFVQLLQLFFI